MRTAAASHLAVLRLAREAGRVAAGFAATGIPEASAVSNTGEYCYRLGSGPWACLNSWGGGPWVKVFTGGPDGTPNNYFTATQEDSGDWFIEDTAHNAWHGKCIGDAYNESGQADTSLDPCPSITSGGGGWGTNFVAYGQAQGVCPNPYSVAFYNTHWGGWLGPPSGWINGSVFYLNKPTPWCFGFYS